MTDTNFKARAKELWHEGSVRRVRVYKSDKDLVSLPFNFAVICALLVPWLIVGGILVALLFGYSAEIQHDEPPAPAAPPEEPPIPHDDI
jgi:Domain of unknown function (DUF4342)